MSQHIKNKLQDLLNQDIDDQDFSRKLKKLVFEQENSEVRIAESSPFEKLYQDSLKSFENPKNDFVFPSFFSALDGVIGGFNLGEFVVLGGRPAMGKTQFLVNLALNLSRNNGVLYFSFDQSTDSIAKRFISCITHLPISKLVQHDLTDEMKTKVSETSSIIKQFNLFINDSCNNSIEAFKEICKKHIAENQVKFIFVDYLQLMSSKRFSRNRELEISTISRELKLLAIELNVCVIASSQLSRSVETRGGDKRPLLSDLRESGAIEQDADKVIFIYRPEYYGIDQNEEGDSTANLVEIIVAKNRSGFLGNAELRKDIYFTHLSDYSNISADFVFALDRLKELDDSHGNKDNK